MEQFENLGTAAVLDADQLSVGQHTEINGKVLIVTKIEGINIFFRPCSAWELMKYRWGRLSTVGKILSGVVVSVVVFVVIWIIRY